MAKDKPIFSHAIKDALVRRGFEILREKPNYNDPTKRVYFFEDTPELRQAFDAIVSGK